MQRDVSSGELGESLDQFDADSDAVSEDGNPDIDQVEAQTTG